MEMHKTLFVHIGFPKTGSTTIQTFLEENRNRLRSGGVHPLRTFVHEVRTGFNSENIWTVAYNPVKPSKPVFLRASRPFRKIIGKDPEHWKSRVHEALSKELERADPGQTKFVVSAETLSHASGAEIRAIQAFFKPFFDRIVVIVFLRPQDELIQSKYSTDLSNGSTRTIEETVKHYQSVSFLRYDERLQLWAKFVGDENIVAREYGRSLGEELGVLRPFLEAVGLPTDVVSRVPKTMNEGMSVPAQELLRSVNLKLQDEDRRKSARVREVIIQVLREKYAGQGTRIPDELRQTLMEGFREGNARLNEKWFGNRADFFAPRERPPSARGAAPAGPIAAEDIALEMARVWSHELQFGRKKLRPEEEDDDEEAETD